MTENEQLAHFDTLGEARMRDYAREAPPTIQPLAYKWLRLRDEAAKREMDRMMQEQLSVAMASERYGRIAAWAAAIAIVITGCAWLIPIR